MSNSQSPIQSEQQVNKRPLGHIKGTILESLQILFSEAFSQFLGRPVIAEVVKSKDVQFGDYQCNSSMKYAKEAKKSPHDVAKGVLENLKSSNLIEKVTIAGPGFINIRISQDAIFSLANQMSKSPSFGMKTRDPLRIIVDFSSPNTAKEMHVGHLRSTIIGDSLARVFEFLGHDVLRLNHIGDWGTSFGMLIAHIKDQPDYSNERVRSYELKDLMRLYKDSKKRFDEDAQFKKTAQLAVVDLQSGNQESKEIWEIICEISKKAYQEIYDLLGVRLEGRGESFYNDMLAECLRELEEKNLIIVSEGAKCLFVEGSDLPLMMQKSDGGFTYDTTDMAALLHRIRDEKANWIIYVVDMGQSLHFDLVFKASEKAGVLDQSKVRVDHVPFGLVLGADGKKFRTRSGETEKLVDLLQEAIKKAQEILEARNPEWSSQDRLRTASILGLGAVKYADLSCHRISDYTFSYERMLRFEGNTAAFIMYSYVRTQSIKRKIAEKKNYDFSLIEIKGLNTASECALALLIDQFSEVMESVVQELLPNRLTEYLYALSEQFNLFFRDCRVEGDVHEGERLALVDLTGRVLKQGLELLGIEVPEKM